MELTSLQKTVPSKIWASFALGSLEGLGFFCSPTDLDSPSANIPPSGRSNTSSQKASSIFSKVLTARGFAVVTITQASPSIRRNVIGY